MLMMIRRLNGQDTGSREACKVSGLWDGALDVCRLGDLQWLWTTQGLLKTADQCVRVCQSLHMYFEWCNTFVFISASEMWESGTQVLDPSEMWERGTQVLNPINCTQSIVLRAIMMGWNISHAHHIYLYIHVH